jgi:ferredoxin-type protein NapH
MSAQGGPKARWRPGLLFWRRLTQVALVGLMAAVPFLCLKDVTWITGGYFAVDVLGLPLGDPLAALQALASSGGLAGRALLGAGLALGLALALGPVFCFWACPYGLASELVRSLRARIKPRPRPLGDRGSFRTRALVAGAGLALVAALAQPPLLNLLSMPGWWSRFFQHLALDGALWPALAFVLALALESVLGRRVWCRFLCPQSVLLSLARRFSPVALRVRFDKRRCVCAKGREGCLAACSLDLDPRLGQGTALACGNCGDCVTACTSRGRALSFGLGLDKRPGPG